MHPAHFDAHAWATVVISLSNIDEFLGGLYVQVKMLKDKSVTNLDLDPPVYAAGAIAAIPTVCSPSVWGCIRAPV